MMATIFAAEHIFDATCDDLVPRTYLVNQDPLSHDFYQARTPEVARNLIGKCLVHRIGTEYVAGLIVETEAYLSTKDEASHAANGRTLRNAAMFERPGTCYVYLSYGINYCMNVVTADIGTGEAVLIRALRPVSAISKMLQLRGMAKDTSGTRVYNISNGPGKLTSALGIDLSHDKRTFFERNFKLIDPGLSFNRSEILTGPRVGISKAADLPLRYFLAGCPWVSKGSGSRPDKI